MNIEARNKLVEDHLSIAKYEAGKLKKKIFSVPFDDLLGYAYLGLIDAANKFDESKGFKFKTYAERRVKGAIIDELRKVDFYPRHIRENPEFEEPINEEYMDIIADVGISQEDIVNKKQVENLVREYIKKLTFREKNVILMYYYKGLTFKEIGMVQGCSEARISIVHKKLIKKLKDRMKDENLFT